jgi:hypothetical protein
MWEVRSETVLIVWGLLQLLTEWEVPTENLRNTWESGYPV